VAKVFAKEMADKKVVSVDGVEIGRVHNVVVDIKTGAIVDLVVKPDMNLETANYRTEGGYVLLPFDAVRSVKSYIVIEQK
jgi:sporulation protein YlmC with PRC-barrel domain